MHKFIRFSIWLILLMVALILTLAFIQPNDVTVSRSIVIKAPKEAVFEQIAYFRSWENWCFLFSNDTSVNITYSGTDGQAGSILDWKGDPGTVGEGSIKNLGIEGTTLQYSFTVTKPGDMHADGIMSAIDTGGATKVTWTFHKHFPFLANAVLIVFDLDKYMGGDFEKSLLSLKNYIETPGESMVIVKETKYSGGVMAGIRDTVSWNELSTFFGDTYNLFINTPTEKITGAPIGIYYDWDTVGKKADLFAGFPVTGTDIPVNGIIFSQIPPSKAFMAVHRGKYNDISRVHAEINRVIAEKGLVPWISVEEYITYPGNEKDSNKWVTKVYVLVQ